MSVTAFTVCGKHSKTPHCTRDCTARRHCTPQRAKLSRLRAPGRGGPRARAVRARAARGTGAGLAWAPPETAADAERAEAQRGQSLVSTSGTVRPHTRHAAPAVNILRTYTVSHARTSCVRPSYGLTSTSTTGDHRNILAHSNDGAPLPQTPPPIVSSAASSRPRLWVVEGGDGMNARRGRMRAGLLRRGAGQGRGRMSAWRLAGRQMGFCRLPPKSPRCGSVSERY